MWFWNGCKTAKTYSKSLSTTYLPNVTILSIALCPHYSGERLNRSLGEKLKRRKEDLERWRDVALVFTSASLEHDSEETAAPYDAAMIIPECEPSHPISTYTNDQPVPQLLPPCESPPPGPSSWELRELWRKEKSNCNCMQYFPALLGMISFD